MENPNIRHVTAGVLDVALQEFGPANGASIVLLHGFPYDVHSYEAVAPALAAAGHRVLVPFLRGYGATRFLDPATPRSGEQAALGLDLIALLDALDLPQAVLAGYDWGGRAACVVAALWPERVRGLVTCSGYNIQNIATANHPAEPGQEHRLWYQYYLHGERGVAGLTAHRAAFARLLWTLWSPTWRFTDDMFARTAVAFENPDFVAVVVHSYRHRFGLVPSDPAAVVTQRRLALQPPIGVPAINLHGADDGVAPPQGSLADARHFTGRYERRELPGCGHNVPQEAPAAFVEAVREFAG